MSTSVHRFRQRNAESDRTELHQDEQLFGDCLSQIARSLWPQKTAAHIAAVADCSERAAEFYLAGHREWSGDAITAIISEILRRHQMRNVRISVRK